VIDCNIIQFPRGRDRFGLVRYPHLGIRLGPAAGARVPVAISRGPYHFTLELGDTRLVHPAPFNGDGSVTEALRADLLWEAVQLVRRGWRPTVHWSADASSTAWANAIINCADGGEVKLSIDVSRLGRADVAEWLQQLRH
jgi:hypothetical protein